jgi:hypothetical protein
LKLAENNKERLYAHPVVCRSFRRLKLAENNKEIFMAQRRRADSKSGCDAMNVEQMPKT